jgi:hypothetical protein
MLHDNFLCIVCRPYRVTLLFILSEDPTPPHSDGVPLSSAPQSSSSRSRAATLSFMYIQLLFCHSFMFLYYCASANTIGLIVVYFSCGSSKTLCTYVVSFNFLVYFLNNIFVRMETGQRLVDRMPTNPRTVAFISTQERYSQLLLIMYIFSSLHVHGFLPFSIPFAP